MRGKLPTYQKKAALILSFLLTLSFLGSEVLHLIAFSHGEEVKCEIGDGESHFHNGEELDSFCLICQLNSHTNYATNESDSSEQISNTDSLEAAEQISQCPDVHLGNTRSRAPPHVV